MRYLMDVPRKVNHRSKMIRRTVLSVAGLIMILAITLGLSRLKQAAPVVERNSLWMDRVQKGEMLREVRGNGTLVPQVLQWIAASGEGRVMKILVLPGTRVNADTIILEIASPETEVSARDAELQLRGAEAELINQRAQLESARMNQEAAAAQVKSEYIGAKLRAEADESLAKDGLVADITLKTSRAKAEELATRYELEKQRIQVLRQSMSAQLSVQKARVDQMRAAYELKRSQLSALQVRAGTDGVLQQMLVQPGQRVTSGMQLAKVAQPELLKAELRIPETLARDVQIGQNVTVDTRNGTVQGHVLRVDPAAQGGTVTVDVSLEGTLPKGTRPDLTVDGTIEIERLSKTLFIGRPAASGGLDRSTMKLFKLINENEAVRVDVELGKSSVNTVEVLSGLKEGDRVILSDMSAYYNSERLRIK